MIVIKAHSNYSHDFFKYASRFTLESILTAISNIAFEMFNNKNKLGKIGKVEKYSIRIGNKKIENQVTIVQTWLVDMFYDIISNCKYGTFPINKNETLYLIHLYSDYSNKIDKKIIEENKKDNLKINSSLLYVFGMAGEQRRFQDLNLAKNEFSRERYILEVISKTPHPKNSFNIDIQKVFYSITGYSIDDYSFLVFFIVLCFISFNGVLSDSQIPNELSFRNFIISKQDVIHIVDEFTTTTNELSASDLNRQYLYSKPIVKYNNKYIASNPHLLFLGFSNIVYWKIRNYYYSQHSQEFLNAFGKYFEIYVEEVLKTCLSLNQFKNIKESNKSKRADWHITIDGLNILVEQKSAISMLSIKQNHPDVELLKKHIKKNWGEAVRQLQETEIELNIDNPIKMILLYEDYYSDFCLDELFILDESLKNDNRYLLITINEFEKLFMLYKTKPDVFLFILNNRMENAKKDKYKSKSIEQLLNDKGIYKNDYLESKGILDFFDSIQDELENYINN